MILCTRRISAWFRLNRTRTALNGLLTGHVQLLMDLTFYSHDRATGRHVTWYIASHSVTYLLPDTSERAPSQPQPAGGYSIYLPLRDERLS